MFSSLGRGQGQFLLFHLSLVQKYSPFLFKDDICTAPSLSGISPVSIASCINTASVVCLDRGSL